MNNKTNVRRIVKMVAFLPVMVLFVALIGFVIMSLWNGLMPAIFGWKLIGYWQAIGLLILCRMLFGGFRGRGGHWRHRLMERCEQMTPEERERFRQGLHDRWGRFAQPDSKPSE
jgi:Na+-driven multidrug efflux pump